MIYPRILYYTGKGGTGKSVIASLTAVKTADLGYKTLLISSDPAHSLRDTLQYFVDREIREIIPNLYAVNVDPLKEASEHYGIILDYIASVLRARGLDELIAYELAALPGMTGVATIIKLDKIVEEGDYDVVIIDTVPSGEALRFLYVPSIVSRISRRMMKVVSPLLDVGKVIEPIVGVPAPPKKGVEKGIELLDTMERIREYLLNHDVTSMRLVANPDSFSIGNIRRTYMQSSLYGLNTDLIVINKIYPKRVKDEYFSEWMETQGVLVEEARKSFYPIPIKLLRLFSYELKGIDKLRKAADELFGDEDPTQIYFKGKTIEIIKKDGEVEMIYPAPYISKSDIEIERIGDELIVHLKTDMGTTDLLIPLPMMTYKMSLKKAKLLNDGLHVFFVGGD